MNAVTQHAGRAPVGRLPRRDALRVHQVAAHAGVRRADAVVSRSCSICCSAFSSAACAATAAQAAVHVRAPMACSAPWGRACSASACRSPSNASRACSRSSRRCRMPPGAYLLARAVMAMLFVAIISLLLTLMAVLVGHVPLTFMQGVSLFVDQRARRAAVLRHRHVPGLAGLRAGVAGHRQPDLPAHGVPVRACGCRCSSCRRSSPTPRRSGPPTTWRRWRSPRSARPARARFAGHVAVLAGITLLFFVLAVRRMQRQRLPIVRRPAEAHAGDRCRHRRRRDRPARSRACSVASRQVRRLQPLQRTQPPLPPARPPPEPPAGVAAPDSRGDRRLRRRIGGRGRMASAWRAAGDDMRGGNSSATQRLVDGGAAASTGALEVTGDSRRRHPVPVRRHHVLSAGPPMQGLMDYSRQEDAELPGARRRPALHASS